MLCFCSAPKALKILLKVYEDIIPTIFYPKLIKNIQFSLKEKQISLMIQILRDNFTVSTSLLPKIEQFFKYEGITFISSLLVPKVNFECCFFIFSQIIGSALKYNTLIKAIIGIIHIHSKLINEKGPENPVVIEYILRDTYLEALTENMNFEILPNLQPNERANTMYKPLPPALLCWPLACTRRCASDFSEARPQRLRDPVSLCPFENYAQGRRRPAAEGAR